MANQSNKNYGYGYIINGITAPQIYSISGGYATQIAYIQPNGRAGAFSYIDEWEWGGRILLTVGDCEAEIMMAAVV